MNVSDRPCRLRRVRITGHYGDDAYQIIKRHEFDTTSGWCIHGCGWRDDGQSMLTPRDVGHGRPGRVTLGVALKSIPPH